MNATGLERVRSGNLLYTDEVGHDACGIGGVAARDGKPSAEVLRKTVLALRAMEHRGGVCGDAGDGAGILAAIPQAFFREEAKRLRFDGARDLRPEDTLAVGVLFIFEYEPARADRVRALVRDALAGGPMRLLGTRPVPTHEDVLPTKARNTKPGAIEHLIFKVEGDPIAADRWLSLRRLDLRHRLAEAGLSAYIPSLSARLVGYKGLMTSGQLADYYADLHNPAFETGIATFHRRSRLGTAARSACGCGCRCRPGQTASGRRPGSPTSTAGTAPTRSPTGRWRSRSASPATTARSTPPAPTGTRCRPSPAACSRRCPVATCSPRR